jgi:hypothetical protein
MWNDPIVAEIRSVREQLAAQFGFDVHAIFMDLRSRQATLGDRVIYERRGPETEHSATADGRSAPLHCCRSGPTLSGAILKRS